MITSVLRRQNQIAGRTLRSSNLEYARKGSSLVLTDTASFNFSSTASPTSFADKIHHEMKNLKVAPSTWFYFLNYRVLPSQVKATGPRGYLTKADLINFITGNKLQKHAVVDEVPQTT